MSPETAWKALQVSANVRGAQIIYALLALQRSLGNARVCRLLEAARSYAPAVQVLAHQLIAPAEAGRPLSPTDRVAFELALHHPLEHVRIHSGSAVSHAARRVGADAFTIGSHVYLADSSPALGSAQGDRVLAHELTHVVQHDRGLISKPHSWRDAVSDPSDPLEREAYGAEESLAVMAGRWRTAETQSGIVSTSKTPTRPTRQAARESVPTEPKDEQLVPTMPEAVRVAAATSEARGVKEVPALAQQVPTPAPPMAPERVSSGSSGLGPGVIASVSLVGSSETTPLVPAHAVASMGKLNGKARPVSPRLTAALPRKEALRLEGHKAGQHVTDLEPTTQEQKRFAGTPAQTGTPDRETEALVMDLGTRAEAAVKDLSDRSRELSSTVRKSGEQARAKTEAAFTAKQEAIQAAVEHGLDQLGETRETQKQRIRAFSTSQRERLQQSAQAKQQEVFAFVEGLKAETLAAGESHAQRAITGSEQRAANIVAQAGKAPASGDPPLVEAQTQSAQQIAQRAAEQCRQTGADVADRVRSEAAQHAFADYGQLLDGFSEQLGSNVTQAVRALNGFVERAASQVEGMIDRASQAIHEMGSQSLATLEMRHRNTLSRIDRWEEKAASAIEAAADHSKQRISQEVSTMQKALSAFSASQQLPITRGQPDQGSDLPRRAVKQSYATAIEGVSKWSSVTNEELTEMSVRLTHQLSSLVDESGSELEQAGGNIVKELRLTVVTSHAGIERLAQSAEHSLTSAAETSLQAIQDAAGKVRADAQTTHQAALAVLSKLVDDAFASEDELISKAQSEIGSANSQISGRYSELKSEAERRNASEAEVPAARIHRGIWSSITGFFGGLIAKVRKWFADTFGEFWGGLLFGILSALVIVAVGWLVMTGLGALLVAAGVTAKVAAIVVLVVGLLVAIPLAIYNRFQEFYADNPGEDAGFWRGLGLVALGIADITGIPFVIEGIVGQRAFGKELKGFERWERLGMGLVFMGAFFISAKNLLRAKPKPEIGEPERGRLPEKPTPRPSATPPEGMSPKLQGLRAGLQDPRAIEQFDRMFNRLGGDSARIEQIVERFPNLEERMIADWEAANPTPRGAALGEVEPLRVRAQALRAEIEAFRTANPEAQGTREWLKALDGEISRLDNMTRGNVEATPEGVQGTRNNINGIESELRTAQAAIGVTRVGAKFPLDGVPDRVQVDVVADSGKTWIDTKRVQPFGLESSDWLGSPGKQGLRTQATEMVRAASQNPLPTGETPAVAFDFPLGVSREVASALAGMGVQVRGPIVNVTPGVTPIPVPVRPPKDNQSQEEKQ